MNELRWKLKKFLGKSKIKMRTGYVLERLSHRPDSITWVAVTIENDITKTLVFDQHPLGQAVPLIMETSDLVDPEEATE
jgi:hypothetical protein